MARRAVIDQISGRHNNPPERGQLALLKDYAREAGWGGRREYWPSVIDVYGVEYDIGSVPEGATFDRLSINDCPSQLPAGLTVNKDCYFGSMVETVPEQLTVGGDLSLNPKTGSSIALPESFQVGGGIMVWSEHDVAQPIPEQLKGKIRVQKMASLNLAVFGSFRGQAGLDGIDGGNYQIVPRRDPPFIDPTVHPGDEPGSPRP